MDTLTENLYKLFHTYNLPTLLRNYDHYSMANGVEVRSPFLDHRLVSYTFSLPWQSKLSKGLTKTILRDAMQPYLPKAIYNRRSKMGFQTPIVDWLKGPWKHYFLELIHSDRFNQSTFIEANTVKQNIENCIYNKDVRYREGELAYTSIAPFLWELLVFEKFKQIHLQFKNTKTLGGLELSVGIEGFAATPPGEAPVALARSEMQFALSALDTPAPALKLAYGHDGLKGVPGTPPELTPGAVKLDATLSKLPVAALPARAMEGGDDPFLMLMQLAEAATQLKLDTLSFDMPIGGVKMSGLALSEAPTAKDQPPRLRATADIAVRGLDALVKRYAADLDEAERKDLLASAALVKLDGIEEKQGDALIHRFAGLARRAPACLVVGRTSVRQTLPDQPVLSD